MNAEDPRDPSSVMVLQALAALNRLTGIHGHVLETPARHSDEYEVDAVIRLHIPGGKQLRYIVETKYRLNQAAVLARARTQMLRATRGNLGEALLVTRHLTAAQLDTCRNQLRMQVLDTAGNAYLEREGLYVLIRGQRPDRTDPIERSANAGTTAWLRIVYVLLTGPEHRKTTYRELAAAAGVALGGVGPVLRDLEHRKLMIADGRERLIVEPERLLNEWVTAYPTRLRPKLRPVRLRAEHHEWWKGRLPHGARWSGEVAADRLSHYLKPQQATIYVQPETRSAVMSQLVAQHGLRADPAGDVEVLDSPIASQPPTSPADIVHPLLVYADLIATLNPRNIEVAEIIRATHLGDLHR